LYSFPEKHIYSTLLFFFLTNSLSASLSLKAVENLNNQLSNSAILCMHQDQYGFMWFGTYDGLNLYNGKDVYVFRSEFDNPNSLLGSCIYSILDAKDSHLWIATQIGVNKFSLKERKVVESFPDYKKTELIAVDRRGNTWIVSKENYLSFYDNRTKSFENIYAPGLSSSSVREIFVDENDELCIVMASGKIKRVTMAQPGAQYPLQIREEKLHEKQLDIAVFENDVLCFMDEDKTLFVYDISKKQKILIRNIAGLVDRYGVFASVAFFRNNLYIAFTHNGLVRLNLAEQYRPELVNMNNGIFCVQKDKNQDALWVGTDGHGIELLCDEKEIFGNILLKNLPLPVNKPVRAFFTDSENSLWFGTKGDGIIRIKDYSRFNHTPVPASHVQHFVTNNGLYENPVFCFEQSHFNPDDLWIGTNGGISCYSYRTDKITVVEDLNKDSPLTRIHSLCEVNDSTLWVATVRDGVCRVVIDKSVTPYKMKQKRSFFFEKGNNYCDEFYSMIYDGDSILTIGSRGGYGVICFNIHTKDYFFVSMNDADNKAIGDVLCVYRSKDSNLYIGSSSGLTVVKEKPGGENIIKQFNRKNGIINAMIHGILEDNTGMIWLSTNKGLVKYNPGNDSFYNYLSPKIGVAEFSDDAYWRCPQTGRLFFGGVNGLVWIESKTTEETAAYEPDLFFFELTAFNESFTLYEYNKNKKLVLPSGKNSFTVSFTTLDYINGENYDYSYLLENYNNTWVPLEKSNRISLMKIPPGNYVLKVKYKNDSLNAGDKIYSLPVTILHPWYLSIWAFVVYSLLFLLVMATFAVYIYRKMQKKQRLVTEKIREEQKEKLLESKLRFFTNVTHELLTPLTLINGSCEHIIKENYLDAWLKKQAKVLKNNVSSLNELIQEIIDFRKIEESESIVCKINRLPVAEIINNQLIQFEEIIEQNQIKLHVSMPDNLYWNTDRACFRKIISNLISNAFKYTGKGGKINVSLSVENEKLKIVVYNTGNGIAADKLHTVFDRYSILENTDVNSYNQMTSRNGLGLFICYSMTRQLQGEISVRSELNQFAEFTVELPLLPLSGEEKEEQPDLDETINLNPGPQNIAHADQTPRILVVDDNREIVDLLSDILSPFYCVMKADSVKKALAIIQKQTPSLIITDILMPETDGLSFIDKLRHDKYRMYIPVIILSAKVDDKDLAQGYDTGADAYLTKPFSTNVLLSLVKRMLAGKSEMKGYFQSPESFYEFSGGLPMRTKDKDFINAVLDVVKKHIEEENLLPEFVAEKMGISYRQLSRQIKRIVSLTPGDFIKNYRFAYAAHLMLTTDLHIQDVIYKTGFTNKTYFYKEFNKKYGLPPKEFKEANKPKS
jgi:signal transduction histidine kinase/ligand-binding sensor domain-containing protein/CheY-like chemotaxis protein/AraC-like DNA-binding protein